MAFWFLHLEKKSRKNNNIWKSSIFESFDSFIHFIVDIAEIKKILDNKKLKYAEFGLTHVYSMMLMKIIFLKYPYIMNILYSFFKLLFIIKQIFGL